MADICDCRYCKLAIAVAEVLATEPDMEVQADVMGQMLACLLCLATTETAKEAVLHGFATGMANTFVRELADGADAEQVEAMRENMDRFIAERAPTPHGKLH